MKKALLLKIIILLISFNFSYANQFLWKGNTNSYWNEPSNWDPGTVPTANDTVTIITSSHHPILRANVSLKKIIITSGVLNVDVYTLTITNSAKLNGGEISKGSGGNLILQGDSVLFGGTLINTSVTATVNNIRLNGSEFYYPTYLELIGNSTSYSEGGTIFHSKVTIKNSGTGLFVLGKQLSIVFQDSANFISTAGEGIELSLEGKTYFNGPVSVSCSAGNILFGDDASDSTFLSAGNKISIGTLGFSNGTFFLRKFIQLGSTSQDFYLTNEAVLNCNNCIFNAPIHITSPIVLLNSSVFNDSLLLLKTGIVSSLSYGGNTFNGFSQFRSKDDGELRLANAVGDRFYENVKFISDAGGTLHFAYNGLNYFQKNIELSTGFQFIGSGNGIAIFSGSNNQTFLGNDFIFNKIKIDKPIGSVTFDKSITVSDSLIFVSGNFITSSSHLLTIKASCKVVGASNLSFVDGPVKKIGNTAFIFPVGNINFYRPIEISAPSATNDAFTAQYFHMGQQLGDSLRDSIVSISTCNYWNLDRAVGTSNITIKLSWDTVGCSLFDTLNLRVVRWGNSAWNSCGKGTLLGDVFSGTISSGNSLSTFGQFAIGVINPISPFPLIIDADFNPDQSNVSWNHTLQPDFMGYNGSSTLKVDQEWWDLNNNTSLPPLLQNNAITSIRIPGGTDGNYWDWRVGWLEPEKDLPNNWFYINGFLNGIDPELPAHNNKIQYFAPNSHLVASNPIYLWNCLTSDFYYQLASLYDAKHQRLPVKYVELGNEFYLNNEHYKESFPNAGDYRKLTDQWCANLKSYSPFANVKIAITGVSTHQSDDIGRKRLWLDQLLTNSSSSNADAITIHEYYGSGIGNVKFSASQISSMLKQPFIKGDDLLNNELPKIESAGLETWITEYNLYDDNHNNIGTWAHGLFVAAMALKYLESPSITKVISHAMNSNAIYGNLYSTTDAYVGMGAAQRPSGNYPPIVRKWEFSATGSALNEIAIASRNCVKVSRINFDNQVAHLPGTSYPELYGWAFDEIDGSRQIILLNMGNNYYNVKLNNLFPSSNNLSFHEIYASDPTSGVLGNPKAPSGVLYELNQIDLTNISSANNLVLHNFSLSRITYIAPNSAPIIEVLDAELCEGEQSSIRVHGGVPPYTIDFSQVDNNPITPPNLFAQSYPFTASITSSSTQTITVNDNAAQVATAAIIVHSGLHDIVSTAGPFTICKGDNLTLNASFKAGDGTNASNGLSYSFLWTPSVGIVPSRTNPNGIPMSEEITVAPVQTTTYQVYITDGVCWSHGDPIEVLVKGAIVDAGKDIILCASTADLNATYIKPPGTGSTPPTYAWSSGATSASFTTPTLTPGNNSFTVTVTDDGCTTSDEVNVFNEDCCTSGTFVISPVSTTNYINDDSYIYSNATSNGFDIIGNTNIFTVTPHISTNTMEINGELYILDKHIVTLQNCTLHLGENAIIKVTSGGTLKLVNCILTSCSSVQKMWQGIKVDKEDGFDDPSIEIYSSTISDANQAIYLARDANYKIDGNTFDNNYEDIVMEKYQGSNHKNTPSAAFTDNYIRGNTFTSSSTTLLNGKYKLTAIDLNDVEFVVIGQNPSGLGNDFDHSSYGIKSTNSGFNSIKSTFNLIKIYGNSKFSQASIFATENNTFSDHTITIGKNGVNTFLESTNGIVTNGPVNLDIKQNIFGTSTSATDRITGNCIKIENTQNKDILVSNSNNFYDYNIGVYLHNVNMFNPQMLHNGTFAIKDNVFITADISSGTNFKGTAIAVHNDFNYFLMNEGEISGNQIGNSNANRQPRIAISISEINNINIHHNEIYFHLGTNPSLYYKGIWMQNSYNALLWKNKIENTVKLNSGPLFTGLESDNCLIPAFYCNRTYKISFGMYFHNDDEFARLQKNEIKQYEIGIQLDNANIGKVQGDDVTQTGYGNEWDDSETSENRVDGQTMSLNYIDWYFNGASGAGNIESVLPANNSVVRPHPNCNDISWDCETDVPSHIASSIQRNKIFGDVIGDSASYTTGYETEQSYFRKTSTYGILSANPALLNINDENDESFQSWFTTKTSSNIGKIANVDRLISIGDFIGAQYTINSIESTNDQEENYKVVYGIYLHHLLTDSAYSTTDSSSLYTIATFNPLIGGNAVYAARNILFLEIEDTPLASNERKANVRNVINSKKQLTVFPIPASEFISLNADSDLTNFNYIIYDVAGRVVLNGSYKFTINLKTLESGIYYIKLERVGLLEYSSKFIVIR